MEDVNLQVVVELVLKTPGKKFPHEHDISYDNFDGIHKLLITNNLYDNQNNSGLPFLGR